MTYFCKQIVSLGSAKRPFVTQGEVAADVVDSCEVAVAQRHDNVTKIINAE